MHGIHVFRSNGNLIGGIETETDRGNRISFNGGDGIAIEEASQVAILRNGFTQNQGLAIDLGDDGVTVNDLGDSDLGANGLLNFPILSEVLDEQVTAFYSGLANAEYRVELFAVAEPDPSNHGEGTTYLGCTEVTTDATGRADFQFGFGTQNSGPVPFCSQSIATLANMADFSLTATHIATGNTSEFSPVFSGTDLTIADFEFDLADVTRAGEDFELPVNVIIRNPGNQDLEDVFVDLHITASGAPTEPLTETITIPAQSDVAVPFFVNLSELLDAGGGVTSIQLSAKADSTNKVAETVESNNTATLAKPIEIDARPSIEAFRSEHATPAYFLVNHDVSNRFDLFVSDWNGDLPDHLVEPSSVPLGEYLLNGGPIANAVGTLSPNAGRPHVTKTINMGKDLIRGNNVLAATVSLLGAGAWRSEPFEITDFHSVGNSNWLKDIFTSVDTTGRRYERITEYQGGVRFPNIAVEGFFDLPVEQVSFLEGLFGTRFQANLRAGFRTDGTSKIEGELEYSVAAGGKLITPGVEGIASATLTGGFRIDSIQNEVVLSELSGRVRGQFVFKTPKAPLFLVPPIFASGSLSPAVDVTLRFIENAEEQLEFEAVTFGIESNVSGSLLAGVPDIAYLEGTVTGTLRGQFQVPPTPTIKARLDSLLTAQAVVRFFTFQVTSPRITLACAILGDGSCADGENASQSRSFPSEFTLAPRQDPNAGEGQSSNGLPIIDYAYAAPSLAVRDDGSMTLVYVDEDPNKENGQQLEIYASHFDGSSWSAPTQLTDDTQLDDRPKVMYDDQGRAVAVWSRIKNTIADPQNAQPVDLLPQLEIFHAVRDPVTGNWSAPQAITDNALMDYLPSLGRDVDGNMILMWRREQDNSL
ncbi:MAG: CARDB domain-containing protein, partial [Planctomycetota bacterium]